MLYFEPTVLNWLLNVLKTGDHQAMEDESRNRHTLRHVVNREARPMTPKVGPIGSAGVV